MSTDQLNDISIQLKKPRCQYAESKISLSDLDSRIMRILNRTNGDRS